MEPEFGPHGALRRGSPGRAFRVDVAECLPMVESVAVRRTRSANPDKGPGGRLRLVVFGVAAAVAIPLLTAAPAHADDYPSWDQVQAAKANAAAAQAEYDKIEALIGQLQQAAQTAAADELKKQFEYTTAKNALNAQTTKLDAINSQVGTAQKDASQAKTQYGKLTSQLYRSGGGDLTAKLLLSNGHASDLLDQLGAVSQLTGHVAQLQTYAKQKQNVVSSLQEQAKQAESIRAGLEQDANTKYLAAQAAKTAADVALAAEQTQGAVLQAQAASLNQQASDIEAQYWVGYNNRKAAASAGPSDSTIDFSAPCTGGCSPGAAQSYAQSVMGSYGWDGSQFSCLVDLWNQESGWRWNAYNSSSGAYGIPQSLPAEKLASAGGDWQTNGDTQINWGLGYISAVYGTPCAAWDHEMSHNPHWY
ncbi:coiled-coil domain-containing protein [Rathayibacter sp. CAU 1779]